MPEPLFILCPPRSYSSVVCSIIGQHPECYGLPELNLFIGDNLAGLWKGFAPFLGSFGRDGMLRTLAQLHDGVQNEETIARANEWVNAHLDWSIRKLFDHIQELVGPKILVEKSPSIVYKQEYIDRMLRNFPQANYLHLLRHPRGTATSVLSLREGHAVLKRLAGSLASLDPERVWRQSHERVMAATANLPNGQCMRLKGEEFLAYLDIYLPQICEWLGISTSPDAIEAMKHPERSPYACPGPSNAKRGNDPNFLENPELDFDRLGRIKEPQLAGELSWRAGEVFDRATVKLARQFGYS